MTTDNDVREPNTVGVTKVILNVLEEYSFELCYFELVN